MSVSMKNHRVELAGSTFMIRSDVDEERIRKIEGFVNEMLARQRGHGHRIAVTDALALALFRVTDLLIEEREARSAGFDEVLTEVRSLVNDLDSIDNALERRIASLEDDAS